MNNPQQSDHKSEETLFAVGEVAIGQGFDLWPEHNGDECAILSRLFLRPNFQDCRSNRPLREVWCYAVQWLSGGRQSNVPFWKLRKKQLPADEVATQETEELKA